MTQQKNCGISLRQPFQKGNNARILDLTKEIVAFKQGDLSLEITTLNLEYCGMNWHSNTLELCAKKQAKQHLDQHTFELLGSVNPEYETVCAQVESCSSALLEQCLHFIKVRRVKRNICQPRKFFFFLILLPIIHSCE